MATIKISTFGGIVPAADDRLLPDNNAADAKNVWLYSGALQGFREKQPAHSLTTPKVSSAFRLPLNFPDGAHISESFWMEFQSSYVDVIRTAVVNDSYERYYWAQQTVAPRYNTRDRIIDGLPAYLLGIPAPGYTPTLSVSGGTSIPQARSYVVTWVSAYGEEGPPCPPVTEIGASDGTWTLNGLVPPNEPERNITRARVYRTITSLQGVATYFFVEEIVADATTYVDSSLDTDIVVNNQLQSATWSGPPSDLEGWVTMPNGIIAGWRDKEVWFSEPYRPHAWPANYAVATEYEIIGLGVAGQTLIVCTQGYPTAITGINPASMSMAKVTTFEPCMSRGSIVSTPEGVYYASPNGLILAANGAFVNITAKSITKDKWQALTRLQTLRAARLGMGYYAFSTGAWAAFDTEGFDEGFFIHDDFEGAHSGFFLDPQNQQTITKLCSETPMINLFNDAWSGELLTIDGGLISWLNVQNDKALMQPYLWKSKIFQTNFTDNFEAMKVYFDPESYDPCSINMPPPMTGSAAGTSEALSGPEHYEVEYLLVGGGTSGRMNGGGGGGGATVNDTMTVYLGEEYTVEVGAGATWVPYTPRYPGVPGTHYLYYTFPGDTLIDNASWTMPYYNEGAPEWWPWYLRWGTTASFPCGEGYGDTQEDAGSINTMTNPLYYSYYYYFRDMASSKVSGPTPGSFGRMQGNLGGASYVKVWREHIPFGTPATSYVYDAPVGSAYYDASGIYYLGTDTATTPLTEYDGLQEQITVTFYVAGYGGGGGAASAGSDGALKTDGEADNTIRMSSRGGNGGDGVEWPPGSGTFYGGGGGGSALSFARDEAGGFDAYYAARVFLEDIAPISGFAPALTTFSPEDGNWGSYPTFADYAPNHYASLLAVDNVATAGDRGLGGNGGGGDGAVYAILSNSVVCDATPGAPNTGGGAGGGGAVYFYGGYPYNAISPWWMWAQWNMPFPANGGSGIAIIRYAGAPRGTGGTITEDDGYTYHTFTTSGVFSP